jgi:hypothetical protein
MIVGNDIIIPTRQPRGCQDDINATIDVISIRKLLFSNENYAIVCIKDICYLYRSIYHMNTSNGDTNRVPTEQSSCSLERGYSFCTTSSQKKLKKEVQNGCKMFERRNFWSGRLASIVALEKVI